ncbi:hypothetical protein AMTRI_Chr10g227620 [Amborella trichopoda]
MSTTTSLSVAAPPAAPSPPPSPPIPTLSASSSWSEGPSPSPTQLSPHIVASSPPSMRTTRPPVLRVRGRRPERTVRVLGWSRTINAGFFRQAGSGFFVQTWFLRVHVEMRHLLKIYFWT